MLGIQIPFDTIAAGPFVLTHGLGVVPSNIVIEMTSNGIVWFQNPIVLADSNYVYLEASDANLTGYVLVYSNNLV